jgi:hypothetical protein
MTTIISKDDFYIIKDQRTTNLYSILFHTPCETIIKSCIKTKIIVGASVSSDYKTLKFKAHSIKTFKQFQEEQRLIHGAPNISVQISAKMIENLASQLNYIITTHNESILGYNTENIIVIDDCKFLYLSHGNLSPINSKGIIRLTFPFSQNDFYMSPEQAKINELPSYIHFKTAYYSLAALIVDKLSIPNEDIFEEEEENKTFHEKTINQLERLFIKDTKLYGVLKRSLVEEPKERSIIFI